MNVDALLDTVRYFIGLGMVLRDYKGHVIACWARRLVAHVPPKMAKGICLKEALSWLRDFGAIKVFVEMDSMLLQMLSRMPLIPFP